MKSCTKCGIEKKLSDFYLRGARYRADCKSCHAASDRQRYQEKYKNDPEFMRKNRERGNAWYQENKEYSNKRISDNHKKERRICIAHYGDACACCGETTYEFLSIDHINGGGEKHRKEIGNKITRWLIKNNFPEGFRVLCHNCNQAYGFYGCCPHQTKFPIEQPQE